MGEKKMRMKVVLLALVSLLFTGMVSASSINGDYKGNPIVKLKSNGQVLDTDVPAMILDGRTLVPISALKQLGVGVTWDKTTYSVDVTLPSTLPTTKDSDKNIATLKLYSKITDHYRRLDVLYDSISDTSAVLSDNYWAINANLSNPMQGSYEQIVHIVDMYNSLLDPTDRIINEAGNNGIDLSDMNTILGDFYDAIEYYKSAYDALNRFSAKQTEQNFDTYLSNSKAGYNISSEATKIITKRYFDFFNKIQSY
jgi:hypothetical protein